MAIVPRDRVGVFVLEYLQIAEIGSGEISRSTSGLRTDQ